MIGEIVWGISEAQEQAVRVFALIIIEICHCPRIQGFVDESAAVFPEVPVWHEADIPGGLTQA